MQQRHVLRVPVVDVVAASFNLNKYKLALLKIRLNCDTMSLHQLVGGSTGPGCSLSHFIGEQTFSTCQSNLAFIWDKCCPPTLCLHLMELHCGAAQSYR